jgi:ribosomal-protein-alanine N-acetyltransferase
MTPSIEIPTKRFLLRSLSEQDVTERYLSWFNDCEAKKFITAAALNQSLSDLKKYVVDRINCDDLLFLAIFDKNNGLHVGNIKYEPVNVLQGYAVMGILIGDPAYRGKGLMAEVLKASTEWLKEHRMIRQVLLGVSRKNLAAVRAYKKAGFLVATTPHIHCSRIDLITMILHL